MTMLARVTVCSVPDALSRSGPVPAQAVNGLRVRKWEQARAAASGLSAVRVVERSAEVRVPASPTRRLWAELLRDLGRQLDDGSAYDRDLPELGAALRVVNEAYDRRPYVRDRLAAGWPILPRCATAPPPCAI